MVPEIRSMAEFVEILGHFLPIYPTNNPKNQNFEMKQKKTTRDIINLHKHTKSMTICYTVPEIWCMTDVIVALFLPFLP